MREEQIQNAITFLSDPSVAESTLDARINFLESKGLTQDEIQEALKRAQAQPAAPANTPTSSASVATTASGLADGTLPPRPYVPNYMMQPPPVPKRDWKDYFIMATVSAGVAYGIYEVTTRYILPMIMPPTPASLEADKEALDREFARTEALVEQLQKDTEELKDSEKQRSQEFEKVITDARAAVSAISNQSDERKQDIKILKSQVESLREMLPKALDRYRESQDSAIQQLQNELKSLKQLVSNRVKSGSSGVPPASAVPSTITPSAADEPFIPDPAARSNGTAKMGSAPPLTTAPPQASASTSSVPNTSTIAGVNPAVPGIPAWQLASQDK